ncbi:filamentous hemagglutinin, partial [Escherichia coli]
LVRASLDATGRSGGGAVHLGGERQGGGGLAHAQHVEVTAGSTIAADAQESGRGGEVVVWSDAATRFAGTITARGGALGGDG